MTIPGRESRVDISPFLQAYQVDPQRGFLPSQDPLIELGGSFRAWEKTAAALPDLIRAGLLREEIRALPAFPIRKVRPDQCELAFLMLAFLAHGYLHSTDPYRTILPANIAVPFVQLGERMGRLPVLSHASLILHNWRRIDPEGPIQVENLEPIFSFTGTADEHWFYHLTTGIEALGGAILYEIGLLLRSAKEQQEQLVKACLTNIGSGIPTLTAQLKRMQSGCDPGFFYHHIRPFLDSLTNLVYEGIQERPVRSYAGGSAAQSSLIQAIESGLAIAHNEEKSAAFLERMRAYMPPAHRSFLASLQRLAPALEQMCAQSSEVGKLRAHCASQLRDFRNTHLSLVSDYILSHVHQKGPGHIGTGGTNPLPFLKQLRNDNARLAKAWPISE